MNRTDELAAKFKAEPSLAEFEQLSARLQDLPEFAGPPSAPLLGVYTAILEARLPVVFANSPASETLGRLFSTPTGLSCVTLHLNFCAAAEIDAYVHLIEAVLANPQIVAQFVQTAPRETLSLIFGSRLLNTVAAKARVSWVGDARAYTQWLAAQVRTAGITDGPTFDRGVKLGPTEFVAEFLFTDAEAYTQLCTVFQGLRPAQQRFVLVHALMPLLSTSPPSQTSRVLADLGVDALLAVDVAIRTPASTPFVRAAVVLARESGKLAAVIDTVGTEWANKAVIERTPLLRQQTMTQVLVAAAASLDPAAARTFAHSSMLTAGVSNHLESTSASIRALGTLVGEIFAKQAGAKLEFGIAYEEDWWIGVDAMDGEATLYATKDANNNTKNSATSVPHLESVLNPHVEADSDDAGDSDDESEEEIMPVFYIKDLIAYVRSDKYGEVHWALSSGPRLVRRKAEFGSELAHYAEELLYAACALTDKYSMTAFGEMRQQLLNAVLEADPSAAPTAVRLFATGDWSLAQRQGLLTALVCAAHALATGEHDTKHDTKHDAKHGIAHGGHEQLPAALHAMFLDAPPRKLEARASTELLQSASTTTKNRRPVHKNMFSEISARFFFPLLAAQPPLRASSYDALVYAQWLRALGMIVAEAYPSRHVPDMVDELWPLLKTLAVSARGSHNDTVLEEAMYSCIVMVVDAGAGIIAQRHASDVGLMLDALVAGISTQPSPKTQQLGRAAVASLAGIAKEIEKRLLGIDEQA